MRPTGHNKQPVRFGMGSCPGPQGRQLTPSADTLPFAVQLLHPVLSGLSWRPGGHCAQIIPLVPYSVSGHGSQPVARMIALGLWRGGHTRHALPSTLYVPALQGAQPERFCIATVPTPHDMHILPLLLYCPALAQRVQLVWFKFTSYPGPHSLQPEPSSLYLPKGQSSQPVRSMTGRRPAGHCLHRKPSSLYSNCEHVTHESCSKAGMLPPGQSEHPTPSVLTIPGGHFPHFNPSYTVSRHMDHDVPRLL